MQLVAQIRQAKSPQLPVAEMGRDQDRAAAFGKGIIQRLAGTTLADQA